MTENPAPAESVGARVRAARKLAGLTQLQLANRAHVSLSLVKKVEQGTTPASPAFIAATARALSVGVAELTSQPYSARTRDDHKVHSVIPALRREIAAYLLPPAPGVAPRPVDQLAAAVKHASTLRQSASLDHLGAELPALIAELRAARHHHEGGDRETGLRAAGRGIRRRRPGSLQARIRRSVLADNRAGGVGGGQLG